jgi:Mg-chelatase subunit ChlD
MARGDPMNWFKLLALLSLLFLSSESLISAEHEQFRIRSFSTGANGEISAIVELPEDSSPNAEDFQLVIDDKPIASARDTRGLVLNTMFLVDVSGSMKGSKKDSPLEDAKNALSSFLSKTKFRSQDQFALTSFADHDTPLSSFKDSREQISAKVRKLETEGKTTRLYQAVDNALKNSSKDDPRTRQIFVVISDGKDEDEQTEERHRQLMADSKASLVPIYTVFRGKTEPPFKAVLSELANAAGGRFFLSRNEPELADALRQIYRLETNNRKPLV